MIFKMILMITSIIW